MRHITFVSVLDAHHLLEDDLAFPCMLSKLCDAPYDILMTQHREVVLILNEIKVALEEMEANERIAVVIVRRAPILPLDVEGSRKARLNVTRCLIASNIVKVEEPRSGWRFHAKNACCESVRRGIPRRASSNIFSLLSIIPS
jgi:hypothetical protein